MTKINYKAETLDLAALLETERAHSARLMRDLGALQQKADGALLCAVVAIAALCMVILF
jgi:hypothetical protein